MRRRYSSLMFYFSVLLLLLILTYLFGFIQSFTKLPVWSLFNLLGILIMTGMEFLSKYGPEKSEIKMYQLIKKLPTKDKVVYALGIIFFIFSGLAEGFLVKDLTRIQTFLVLLVDVFAWACFTKLFGSRELFRIMWIPWKNPEGLHN